MALSQDQVIEALRPVQDPELHRSIVDLQMVREVVISGSQVRVLIALTVAGCPMKAEITERVTAAVTGLDDVTDVAVDMTVMTSEELEAVRSTMGDHGGHGHSHGPSERQSPFVPGGSRTRILAITSGKGGVGKSTVTVNLAVALAKAGYDTGVLDADVYGFSVPQMLGVDDEPEIDGDMVIPPVSHGVTCISIGFFVEDDKPVMWRGPMLHKALEQFLVDVKWGDLDFLLVDMPPGTGDVAMSMAKVLPQAETFVVTTPQPAAQRVAQRSGAMARELGSTVAGVIENMSWYEDAGGGRQEIFGSGGGEHLAQQLDAPLLARIPLVTAIREGGDEGRPAVVGEQGPQVASAFDDLAAEIVSRGPRRIYRQELKVT